MRRPDSCDAEGGRSVREPRTIARPSLERRAQPLFAEAADGTLRFCRLPGPTDQEVLEITKKVVRRVTAIL